MIDGMSGDGNGSFLDGQAQPANTGQTTGGGGQGGTPPGADVSGGQGAASPVTGPGSATLAGSGAAPLGYQPFQVGEGIDPIDDATHQQLTALGKESNLTQEQIQKWVNLGISKLTDGQEAVRLKLLQQVEDKKSEWEKSTRNDDEIKPYFDEQGNLPKISEFINRAMGNREDTKKFLDMAEETGLGVNPLFMKFCIRAGKLMGEAPFLEASRSEASRPRSMLDMANALIPDKYM